MSHLVHSEGSDRFYEPGAPVGFKENRLPHWHQVGAWIFVTWRLFDSLPRHLLDQLKQEQNEWMEHHLRPWSVETATAFDEAFSDKVEAWVNAGYGGCFLRDGRIRGLVESVIRFGDTHLYDLGDFVLMPNHLHLLFRPFAQHPLSKAVHAWKGTSAKKNQPGPWPQRAGVAGGLLGPDHSGAGAFAAGAGIYCG